MLDFIRVLCLVGVLVLRRDFVAWKKFMLPEIVEWESKELDAVRPDH